MSTQIRGAQIRDLFAGDGLDWVTATGTGRNYLAVNVDDSSIGITGDALYVKDSGITNAMISGDIADDKLAEDYIKTSEVDGTTIEFLGGSLNVVASGITETELNPSVAGDGLAGGGGTPLAVNVDNTTIQIVGDTLEVISSGTGLDHGALNGLADDDHPQYLRTDGTRELSGTWNYGSETISGAGDIYTTGDVGIGVEPNSSYPLYVAGDVLFEDAGSNGGIHIKYDNANNSEVFSFWNSGGWKTPLSISDTEANLLGFLDGYVGIGNAVFGTASGTLGTRINEFSIDGTMAGNSDNAVPTEQAVVTYVNNEITTASGDILTYVSDNYIDNTEMTTISGDIIDYVDAVDHSMYSLTDGTRPFTGTVSGVTPTEDAHLTTKQYVDSQDATISGDIISYVDDQDTALSGALETNIIWEVIDTPTDQIRPKAAHMGKAIYTSGNLTVGGDLTVTGTLFYTDTETVQISDNTLIINYGEVGAGVTGVVAGIEVDRGSESDYWFMFDERSDNFRIGVSGTQTSFNDYPLQPVATREDTPTDTRVSWWDAANYTFRTQGDTYITVNSGTDTIALGANSVTELTIGTGGIKLKDSTVDVNEILNTVDGDSIDASSTDDQLATAKLIYNEISTLSGTVDAIDHDGDLNGLNGGDGVDYWHLNSTAYTALSGVDAAQVGTWDTAYGWGNHASAGYLTSFTESDPVFGASTAAGITSTDISNWDTAYGWGDWSVQTITVSGGDGLTATGSPVALGGSMSLAVNVDNSTIEIDTDALRVMASGITENHLAMVNAPVTSGVLSWNGSGMEWVDIDTELSAVVESDIRLENESANCNGATTAFTLDATPVVNSLQVFLNGLIQEKGSGKDYTHTGTTVTFGIAPLAGDILLIHYIAKD